MVPPALRDAVAHAAQAGTAAGLNHVLLAAAAFAAVGAIAGFAFGPEPIRRPPPSPTQVELPAQTVPAQRLAGPEPRRSDRRRIKSWTFRTGAATASVAGTVALEHLGPDARRDDPPGAARRRASAPSRKVGAYIGGSERSLARRRASLVPGVLGSCGNATSGRSGRRDTWRTFLDGALASRPGSSPTRRRRRSRSGRPPRPTAPAR